MEDFSDSAQLGATPSNFDDPDQPLNSSLDEGLRALKQKNYAAAIASLKPALQATRPLTVLKAQMALVKAYQEIGQIEQAIALCQTLSTSANQRTRSWAAQTLSDLAQRYPQAGSALREAAHSRRASVTPQEPASRSVNSKLDQTGFVPLENSSESSDASLAEADATGFVPLNSSSANVSRPSIPRAENRTVIQPVDEEEMDETGTGETSLANPFVFPADVEDSGVTSRPELPTQIQSHTQIQLGDRPLQPTDPQSDSTPAYFPRWRQAGRAQRWTPLGTVKQWQLWLAQIGTTIALFWIIRAVLEVAHLASNAVFSTLRLYQFVVYGFDPTWWIIYPLIALFCGSPWILDFLLRRFYGLKSLNLSRLENYSPESARVLKRICGQRRWTVPALGILPTTAPLALTYGCLPRKARIVVSQGLLEQLADDEIAAICAGELAHIAHWDFAILSLVALVTQLPYLLYRQAAQWGDRQQNPFLRGSLAVVAAVGYWLYRAFRWAGLWLSRLRVYYSDRTAVEITGNPNGLTRALLKIAISTTDEIRRQRQTSNLIESFELLAPVGYQTALSLGSIYAHVPLEPVLEWDRSNPYRNWLAISNVHPPLGDRLQLLTFYARHWRLETELDLNSKPTYVSSRWSQRFGLQVAPFLGVPLGILVALALWLIGGIADTMQIVSLDWLWGDRSILLALIPIGFSVGTFLRINSFFPDIKPSNLKVEPSLPDLLKNPASLPIDSLPVQLHGKLLGRQGIGNWLGQDLILDTQTGLIKIHHCSQLGQLGNLLPQSPRPNELVNRSVTITGWFRRGATPWIDLELLQSQRDLAAGSIRKVQSAHPIWSTLLGFLAAVCGAYLIIRGGF
ncbi:M48 family metalloprotease [Oculatella sp. FACHB-28]|uniref:zinc metalloprotease HtpX n=1 Tax=Oculatella sp. FACHB-28 TaxID=2692845 RepID=UPI001683031A|nr:zinc metalloprotease HtpX [Oculatella sp. FACHB-28]MBD2060443.1 M48 family metalloprotease [Oculatella sp. FACHB-28]